MLYGKYKELRNATWQLLLDLQISQLPISVNDIAQKLNIKIIKNSLVPNEYKLKPNEYGCTIFMSNKWYIIYNNNLPDCVSRFTIAHEFGHILLGHFLEEPNNLKMYRTFQKRDSEEQEADMFAARLLAPACVLWGLNLHTPEEIKQVCNISYQAATFRAERMEILYQRNMFLTSALEQKVYKQFDCYIQNNKKNKL